MPHQWGVIGISREQWTLVAAALSLGGNVRVGLEDNFYLPDGEMARSNGDLVAKARQMAENAGRRVATVAETRELLGLGVPNGHRSTRNGPLGGPPAMSSALEGLRVLDLSRLLPGGFCSLLLADFGADVIKVEDTGMGDYVRWAPPTRARRRASRFPRAQPRQALDPHRPQDPARARACCSGWRATPTSCSSRSGPA